MRALLASLLAWVQREPARAISIVIALVPGVISVVNLFGIVVAPDGSTAILNLLNTIVVLAGGQAVRANVTPAAAMPPTDFDSALALHVPGDDPTAGGVDLSAEE